MRLYFVKNILVFALFVCALAARTQPVVLFHEGFDTFTAQGGNDGKWKGVNGNSAVTTSDFGDWVLTKVYKASNCVKLGTTSAKGSLALPTIAGLDGECTLAFRAGAWDDSKEHLTLVVALQHGSEVQKVTLARGEFRSYTVKLTGATPSSRIVIEGEQDKNNRFFLDEIKVTKEQNTTPPVVPQPQWTEVTDLAALRALSPNTRVKLTLGRNNMGHVLHVKEKGEAYIGDAKSAVLFHDFLTTNPGWHTSPGGAIVGSLVGEYFLHHGMPAFRALTQTDARTVLCLDQQQLQQPKSVTLAQAASTDLRAQLVQIDDVEIERDGTQFYAQAGGTRLPLSTHLQDFSEEITSTYRHVRYEMRAIVGAADAGTNVLYPIAVEQKPLDLVLRDDRNNDGELASLNELAVNVVVKRQLVGGMWNSLCLPFDMELEEDLGATKLAKFTGVDPVTRTLQFTSTENLEAGVPYLIFPDKDYTQLTARNTVLQSQMHSDKFEGVEFRGIFSPVQLASGDASRLFIGRDNKLSFSTTDNRLKAFRAYFQLNGGKVQRIRIDDTDLQPTAIQDVLIEDAAPEETLYNLAGQRVPRQAIEKGVYITRNGKRILK